MMMMPGFLDDDLWNIAGTRIAEFNFSEFNPQEKQLFNMSPDFATWFRRLAQFPMQRWVKYDLLKKLLTLHQQIVHPVQTREQVETSIFSLLRHSKEFNPNPEPFESLGTHDERFALLLKLAERLLMTDYSSEFFWIRSNIDAFEVKMVLDANLYPKGRLVYIKFLVSGGLLPRLELQDLITILRMFSGDEQAQVLSLLKPQVNRAVDNTESFQSVLFALEPDRLTQFRESHSDSIIVSEYEYATPADVEADLVNLAERIAKTPYEGISDFFDEIEATIQSEPRFLQLIGLLQRGRVKQWVKAVLCHVAPEVSDELTNETPVSVHLCLKNMSIALAARHDTTQRQQELLGYLKELPLSFEELYSLTRMAVKANHQVNVLPIVESFLLERLGQEPTPIKFNYQLCALLKLFDARESRLRIMRVLKQQIKPFIASWADSQALLKLFPAQEDLDDQGMRPRRTLMMSQSRYAYFAHYLKFRKWDVDSAKDILMGKAFNTQKRKREDNPLSYLETYQAESIQAMLSYVIETTPQILTMGLDLFSMEFICEMEGLDFHALIPEMAHCYAMSKRYPPYDMIVVSRAQDRDYLSDYSSFENASFESDSEEETSTSDEDMRPPPRSRFRGI